MSAPPRAKAADRTQGAWAAALSGARLSRLVIYVGFLIIFAAFAVLLRDDGFATPSNLLNIVQQTAPVTVMAVGMVFVLTAGEIDLSIGSIVAVAALLAAMALRDWPLAGRRRSPGSASGRRSARSTARWSPMRGLPSFLVTLATMGVFAGVGRRMTDLKSVPIENDAFNGLFGSGRYSGVPSLFRGRSPPSAIGLFVFAQISLRRARAGDGRQCARRAGDGHQGAAPALWRAALSGTLAALAGLLYAGRLHGARYTLGEGDLLDGDRRRHRRRNAAEWRRGSILGALIGSC